jgi:putative membrane protein
MTRLPHAAIAAASAALAMSLFAPAALAADKLSSADESMLKDIAQANIAEVESGKLALEKSANPEIKNFAQMMVDDHSKGLEDTKALASSKSASLPDGPDAKHKAVMIEFKTLSGGLFDSRYVKQAGVGDHEATAKLLKKTQAEAKDADLKALATKMLPVVQGHLQHAQDLAAKTGK